MGYFTRTFVEHLDLGSISPVGATTIWHWLSEMREAACEGDQRAVARYMRLALAKLVQERKWADET